MRSRQGLTLVSVLLGHPRYLVTAAHGGANARADTAIAAGRTQDLELALVPIAKPR